jgi:hypothetical protein
MRGMKGNGYGNLPVEPEVVVPSECMGRSVMMILRKVFKK